MNKNESERHAWVAMCTRNSSEWRELLHGPEGILTLADRFGVGRTAGGKLGLKIRGRAGESVGSEIVSELGGERGEVRHLWWFQLAERGGWAEVRGRTWVGMYVSEGWQDPMNTLPFSMRNNRRLIEDALDARSVDGTLRTMTQGEVWRWLGLWTP